MNDNISKCHCGKDGHALNSVNCPVHGHGIWTAHCRKQERRIHRLVDKLTDILAISQEGITPCWQKIQNIEATAANAIAVDLNILDEDLPLCADCGGLGYHMESGDPSGICHRCNGERYEPVATDD